MSHIRVYRMVYPDNGSRRPIPEEQPELSHARIGKSDAFELFTNLMRHYINDEGYTLINVMKMANHATYVLKPTHGENSHLRSNVNIEIEV